MKSPPTIAVVGASVRAVACSLLRSGINVVAADLFADADLTRACPSTRIADYPDGLAQWLAPTECDGWLYTGALENHPDLIERMSKLCPLIGNRGDVLRQVRDPLLLQKTLRSAGLNFPETGLCSGGVPDSADWLHKTGQGGNGSGVRTFDPQSNALATTGFWQRRIDGTCGSAIYLDDQLRGVTRQLVGESWLGAGEFQYCGTIAPWLLPAPALDDLARIGQAIASLGVRGLYGVDFLFDGERVWALEVNPRPTAATETVERVSGLNLLTQHLEAFGVAVPAAFAGNSGASGKVVLYAKQRLEVSQSLSERLLADAGPFNTPQLADIPHPNIEIAVGEPILTVLADGSSSDAVEQALRKRVAALESDLYRD